MAVLDDVAHDTLDLDDLRASAVHAWNTFCGSNPAQDEPLLLVV